MSGFITPTKIELEEMYLDNKYSMHKIADILNISVGSVYNYIKKYNIPTREQYKGRLGAIVTKETREKLSKSLKGRVLSPETRRKISESQKQKGIGHKKKRTDGYIYLFYPEHPCSTKDGYIMEHHYVMEKHIGRYLNNDEVVHHINHIRSDNRIENLQLMTFKEHAALHMKERWAKKKEEQK